MGLTENCHRYGILLSSANYHDLSHLTRHSQYMLWYYCWLHHAVHSIHTRGQLTAKWHASARISAGLSAIMMFADFLSHS
jgi:hypothetical protein